MTAYQPALWHDLFVAMAGAAAALAGLIFVAVSINLEQILKYRGRPAPAGRFQRADRSTMLPVPPGQRAGTQSGHPRPHASR